MIQWMEMKVIIMKTMMHEIKKISILYTKLVLADCLSYMYPDLMHASRQWLIF